MTTHKDLHAALLWPSARRSDAPIFRRRGERGCSRIVPFTVQQSRNAAAPEIHGHRSPKKPSHISKSRNAVGERGFRYCHCPQPGHFRWRAKASHVVPAQEHDHPTDQNSRFSSGCKISPLQQGGKCVWGMELEPSQGLADAAARTDEFSAAIGLQVRSSWSGCRCRDARPRRRSGCESAGAVAVRSGRRRRRC